MATGAELSTATGAEKTAAATTPSIRRALTVKSDDNAADSAPPPPPALRPHTVSGFSSGATLAVNHGVAFAASVRGIGVLGGSPYGCNILPNGADGDFTTCSYWTGNITRSADWLSRCDAYLKERAARGVIDSLEHLKDKPVYLFSVRKMRSNFGIGHCFFGAKNNHFTKTGLGQVENQACFLQGTRDSMVWQRTMRAVEQQFRGLGAADKTAQERKRGC